MAASGLLDRVDDGLHADHAVLGYEGVDAVLERDRELPGGRSVVVPVPVRSSSVRSVGVIGGGIRGLAGGREITRRSPGVHVVLVEKEDRLATHQTGHDSGVARAGLYYPPGSLWATLCRRGVGLLQDFCSEHGVAYRELGKPVVATDASELDGLDGIEKRARANGVPNLARLDQAGMTSVSATCAGCSPGPEPYGWPASTGVRGFAKSRAPCGAVVSPRR